MTEKLYYQNPYLKEFQAEITGRGTAGGKPYLELSATAFYPEGGGQPADRGLLGGLDVTDVRKEGDRILHFVSGNPASLPEGPLTGRIDWAHRFDYMQQHTGQHILSGAFHRVLGLATVSVHQGESLTSIELEAREISREDLYRVEDEANRIVTENRPLQCVWTESDKLSAFRMRRPTSREGAVRIVSVDDFDCVACGGVHVLKTGQVGLIHNSGWERIRGRLRTHWKIGRRAIEDYRRKTEREGFLIDFFSAPAEEIRAKTEALGEELRLQRYAAEEGERARAELLAALLPRPAAGAQEPPAPSHPFRTVLQGEAVWIGFNGEEPSLVKKVAMLLTQRHRGRYCLTLPTERGLNWFLVMPEAAPPAFQAFREHVLPRIAGKGGGKAPLWQGIGREPQGLRPFRAAFLEWADGGQGPA